MLFFRCVRSIWRQSVLMLLSLVAGCSVSDPRDECCGNIEVNIHYVPYGVEEFTTYLHSLRHFLFDETGHFLYEVPAGPQLQRLRFTLSEGSYTLLTLGNADQELSFKTSDHTLSTLEMELSQRTPKGKYLNSDELYWGYTYLEVTNPQPQRYDTYMNNIHCHLHVKVQWSNMPEDIGTYRMELHELPVGYTLNPEAAQTIGDKVIPPDNGNLSTYVQRTELKSQELRGEFVTMRYTSSYIPVFELWFGEKAVTSPIDLGRAFKTWGWDPDATAVQEYRIQLTIYSNGSVEVRPWIDADVEDWQDGGTFS